MKVFSKKFINKNKLGTEKDQILTTREKIIFTLQIPLLGQRFGRHLFNRGILLLTIKLPIQTSSEDSLKIKALQREQSSLQRWAFNRCNDGNSQKEIRNLSKNLNSIDNLDSWFIQSGIINSKGLAKANDGRKVIFGGRKNWNLLQQKKITNEEWKELRLLPLHVEGEAPKKGNRKFELDIQNEKVWFKPCRGTRIEIKLPSLRLNWKQKLTQLQDLAQKCEIPYSVDLTSEHISISFELNETSRLKSIVSRAYTKKEVRDEAQQKLQSLEKSKNSKRVLGIDQNPNYLGVSILEFDKDDNFKTIYKSVIDFKELNKKSGESSQHKDSKYKRNKKKHELIESCKKIQKLANHFKVEKIVLEELNFGKSKLKGRALNRLCKNSWDRSLFRSQIEKRCIESGIEVVEINAAYSSQVGNINYGSKNTPDMIAASVEIARRGWKKFQKGWFYPALNDDRVWNLWKKEELKSLSWKELFKKIKELKLKYRFPLENTFDAVFRQSSYKSNVIHYVYTS